MPQENHGRSSMQAVHRTRIEQIRNDVTGIAGTALKIAESARLVLEQGGMLSIQQQLNYLTGALARLTKDAGVVEYLQGQGVQQRKPPIPRS